MTKPNHQLCSPRIESLSGMLRGLRKALLVFLLLNTGTVWAAVKITHRPATLGVVNLPTLITASLTEPDKFLWAKLHVRKATETAFVPVQMTGSGLRFTAEIPKKFSVEQGTQYYLEVFLRDSTRLTLPQAAPSEYFTIKNQATNSRIGVSIIYPEDGSQIEDEKTRMSAVIRGVDFFNQKERILVYLDGKEISPDREAGYLHFNRDSQLSAGRHRYEIRILDEFDTEIANAGSDFFVRVKLTPAERIKQMEEDKSAGIKKKEDEAGKWKSKGSASMTYQYSKTRSASGDTPLPYPNGYYTVQGQYESRKDDSAFFIGPFLATSQKADGGSRVNQFSFAMQKSFFNTKWGTISSQLSDLSASGVSLLGGEVSLERMPDEKAEGWRSKIFAGQTRLPVESYEDPNNLGVYSQYVYGGQVAWAPWKNFGYFSLQGALSREDDSSLERPGLIPFTENQASSLYMKYFMPAVTTMTQIEFEYGVNRNIIVSPILNDLGMTERSQQDIVGQGFHLKGTGNLKILRTDYNWQFRRMDPRFLTAFGSSSADTMGGDLSLNHSVLEGKITWSEGLGWATDNLENNKPSATISRNANVSTTLNFKPLPSLTLSDNIQEQTNHDNNQFLRQINNNFSASTSYSFNFLALTWAPGLAFSQTDSLDYSSPRLSDDSTNRNYSPALAWNFSPAKWVAFNWGVNYSFSETLTRGQTSESYSSQNNISDNFGVGFKFLEGKLGLPVNFSHSVVFDSREPKQSYSDTYNGSIGVQYNLTGSTFNLSTSYTVFRDHLNASSNYEQYSLTFTYTATL